jgi:UDP-N-acetylmuramate--alanine ligase
MLRSAKHVYMIGIGGSGMSGIARMLLANGCAVGGSDSTLSPTVRYLQKLGAAVHIGHSAENLPPQAEVVVRSEAVKMDNPEVVTAASRGLRVMSYAQALGDLMQSYRGVAVSGTHGKTTTTAMTTWILSRAGLEPNFVVGGKVPLLGGSSGVGEGNIFVAEACEYRRSFLNLVPEVAIINNIEEDHLDYYKDLAEIIDTFGEFASRIPKKGLLIVNGDDANAVKAARKAVCRRATFGFSNKNDWHAANIENAPASTSFETCRNGKSIGRFRLQLSGEHNVMNALAAAAVADYFGVAKEDIVQALSSFTGVGRRFEELGERDGVTVVTDYAHHPTAVRVTLKAARTRFPGRRIWCVFQPHQCSRTRYLLKDFARSFGDADLIIIPDIFSVRDSAEERKRVSSADLVREIKAQGGNARYIASLDEVVNHLVKNVQPGDVVMTMGAGNIDELAESLLAAPWPVHAVKP